MTNERSCKKCRHCNEKGACPKFAIPGEVPVPVMDIRLRLPLVCRFYAEPEPVPAPSAADEAWKEHVAMLLREYRRPLGELER